MGSGCYELVGQSADVVGGQKLVVLGDLISTETQGHWQGQDNLLMEISKL